jgi:peptidoglycan hydrolase-like protein with peptidoglycan-binding domain
MSGQQSSSSWQGSSQVREVQQALKDKGLDVGQVDGQMGPQTKSALKQFQQQQNLPQTGELDQQTIAALGISGSASSSTSGASQGSGATGSTSGSAGATGSTSSQDQGTSSTGSASQGSQGSSTYGGASQGSSGATGGSSSQDSAGATGGSSTSNQQSGKS